MGQTGACSAYPRKSARFRAGAPRALLRRQLGSAGVPSPPDAATAARTTSRSNLSDVSPAEAPISCDLKSAIDYDVKSAINSKHVASLTFLPIQFWDTTRC
jgi:hypothetical protein